MISLARVLLKSAAKCTVQSSFLDNSSSWGAESPTKDEKEKEFNIPEKSRA